MPSFRRILVHIKPRSVGHIISTPPSIAIKHVRRGYFPRFASQGFDFVTPPPNAPLDPGYTRTLARSVISQLKSPTRLHLPLELLHLTQANARRDPAETDQSAEPPALGDFPVADPKTGDAPLERFLGAAGRRVVLVALQDAADDVVDVALVPLLHGGGEFALAFGLPAVFADDGSADDFDFGDVVVRLRCVAQHRVR